VSVSIVDGSSRDVVERVRTGSLDAAVVNSSRIPRHFDDFLDCITLGNDQIVVIEAEGTPFSHRQTVPLLQLSTIPFVRIAGRRSLASTLDPLLVAAGLEPARTLMELGTWEGLKDAVRLGLGAAVVFRSVVQRELSRGELQVMSVAGFSQTREIALISSPQRRNERMTPVFRALLEHLQAEAPTIAKQFGLETTGPGRADALTGSSRNLT
jgi:DNA-binding transcriptional LysR family regulator